MMKALVLVEEYYKRIFAFRDMFYEFLQNGSDKRYIAAIKLRIKYNKSIIFFCF